MSHISGGAGWWQSPSPVLVRASGAQGPGLLDILALQSSVKAILGHLGLPIEAPRVAPARGPPDDSPGLNQAPHFDPSAPDPVPEYEFDQRVSW
jgi:hypothetical protein